ncbi:DnaJ domain-containing protein [bacterium]|nr:DnaJ domain-containing protein [candidate division CSSED10-310 bacterium]
MSDEDRTVTQELEELYERQKRMNFYQILELGENADQTQIKRAFRKLVSVYHPDRYIGELTPELQDKLVAIFDSIKRAYEALSDTGSKVEYDRKLARGELDELDGDSMSSVAVTQYTMGLEALKENDVPRAIEFFKSAIEMNPCNPEYFAKLALAQSSHTRFRGEALGNAQKALKMNPENANYYALIGRIYQKMDKFDQAETYYHRALGWEPRHRLARQELANIRQIKKEMNKSTLDKIKNFFKGKGKKNEEEPREKPGKRQRSRSRPQPRR